MAQPEENGTPQQIEYELKSRAAAQALYRSVTEFHTFFQQDKVSSVVKNAGYCKSIIGSFKGQSPDRFYFDVARTHKEVVNHLWPILNPNSHHVRPHPPPLPPTGFPATSMTSLASQRSTRSLPSHSPHHRPRAQTTLPRSVSSDHTAFRRVRPPAFLPPISATTNGMRRGSDGMPRPPPSPFNPYASNIDYNTDSDDQSTYVSGNESDTYVCMRSTSGYVQTGSDTYTGTGSDTYVGAGSDSYVSAGSDTYMNSGISDVSSSSENRAPSPPPMYSEVDPNQEVPPSPPPRSFTLNPDNFRMTGILQGGGANRSSEQQVFNFNTCEVLSRTRELETELQRLRSAMTCRVCKIQPLGATFCPCGHTVCCYHCASTLYQCYQCNVPIENVQRMLLA